MAKSKVTTSVDGVDEDGNAFHYDAGDEVDSEHAKLITNPAVFDGSAHQGGHYDEPNDDVEALDADPDEVVDATHDEFDGMERAALEAEADARDVSYTKAMKDDTLRDKIREAAAADPAE